MTMLRAYGFPFAVPAVPKVDFTGRFQQIDLPVDLTNLNYM